MTPSEARQMQLMFREDPARWVYAAFNTELYPRQAEILQSVFNNPRTVARSGHATGKTFVSATALLAFMLLQDDAICISTAPTQRQCRDLLWKEVHGLHARAASLGRPLGGELQQLRYELSPTSFAIGFSTEKTGGGIRLQGFHAKSILLLFDEAAGIPQELWEAAEGLMTGDNSHWLAIGNPLSKSSSFYNASSSSAWNSLRLSSWDTPNVQQGREVVPGLASKRWCEHMLAEYGEESGIYAFRVLGEFPDEGIDTLIQLAWVEAAINRERVPGGIKVGGCDVARFGDDQTVIVAIDGGHVEEITKFSKAATTETAGRVIDAYKRLGWTAVAIDDTGVGGGVTDMCREAGLNVIAVNFASAAVFEPDKYNGIVTELFTGMAEDLRAGSISGLPQDSDVTRQLVNRRYGFSSDGRMKVESKADFKKRIRHSPDEGDALLLANFARRIGGSWEAWAQLFI